MQTLYPLIWIAFIICLFLVWFFSHRANHKERLMMIEKGMDVEEAGKKKPGFRFPWFKIGLLIVGLSVGLLLIALLAATKKLDQGGNTLPLAILGVCGGLSMVIANYLDKDKKGS